MTTISSTAHTTRVDGRAYKAAWRRSVRLVAQVRQDAAQGNACVLAKQGPAATGVVYISEIPVKPC